MEVIKRMSGCISSTMVDLVHRLDELAPLELKKVLPEKDYDRRDIDAAADLISKMLKWVPAERISCAQALKHRFFDDVKDV